MGYRIKEVSEITGISVRMLRHYDRKGLLEPGIDSSNGYRDYSRKDIVKLGRILVLKELDFAVGEMKTILEGGDEDCKGLLRGQLELLREKRDRLDGIISMLEERVDKDRNELFKEAENMFEPFNMKKIEEHKKKYAGEARDRYKGGEAYAQSVQRTDGYDDKDWKRIMKEAETIFKKLAALMAEGAAPDSEKAIEAIGEWRKYINGNFYECTDIVFEGLADLYESDSRYSKNMDRHGKGLSAYMSGAIRASLGGFREKG